LFRAVKDVFDPANLLNPGVKLPATGGQRPVASEQVPDPDSPISRLKVGSTAATLPDDITAALRDVERNGSWDRDRLSLANSPSVRHSVVPS
jgi:hypothetical protein